MKKFNKKFIFITIVGILSVLLLSIFSVNIIVNKINSDSQKASEANARNRLYNILSLASNEKENNSEYNSENFLTNFLTSNGLIVNDNIISLDNWNFEIDRENLNISNTLGATQITFDNDIINYFAGTTSDGKKIITASISVNSNIPLEKIIFENNDGTFTTEEINNNTYSKNIDLFMDKKYLITVVAKDGKTKLETFQEFSDGKFDSLFTIADKCIKKDGVYKVTVNGETYGIHAYVYDQDTTLTTTTFGDENDPATNMILVKVNGNLTLSGTQTTCVDTSTSYKGGPKGFFIYCTGTLTNNGTISMTSRGARCPGQNVYLWKNDNETYEYVPAQGQGGGSSLSHSFSQQNNQLYKTKFPYALTPYQLYPATGRASGGGGSGGLYVKNNGNTSSSLSAYCSSSSGGTGTSYSGGTGGGGAAVAYSHNSVSARSGGSNGGAGGNGNSNGRIGDSPTTSYAGSAYASGGAGNPDGVDGNSKPKISSGTGGLLIIYANSIINNGTFSSNGSTPSFTWSSYCNAGGGGSGGGSVNIFYKTYLKKGTITSNGGKGHSGSSGYDNDGKSIYSNGGNGGDGSISCGSIATGSYVATP